MPRGATPTALCSAVPACSGLQRWFSSGQERSSQQPAEQGQQQPDKEQQNVQAHAKGYDTTPLMMDARGTAPLKSTDYASSHDDAFGVQRNWFTSLYKQLNYFAKTGVVPGIKGRQKEVRNAWTTHALNHATRASCMHGTVERAYWG